MRTAGPRRNVALVALLAALVPVGVLSTATPATAHRGTDGGSYRSHVTGLSRAVDGVGLSTSGPDGAVLTVANEAEQRLVVLGYDGEQFARLEPGGAWVNARSGTTARAAADRLPGRVATATGDSDAEPQWEQVAARGRFTWLDERIGWAGEAQPAEVAAAPAERHLVRSWHIPVRYGEQSLTIDGETWWEPTRYSAGLTMALGLGVIGVGLVGALVWAFPRRRAGVPGQHT